MKNVYINDIASYLPNEPVPNEDMENVLGKIGNLSSRTKNIILKNNGIKRRHYAIDPENGNLTDTNATLTACAIKNLAPYTNFTLSDIELLSCGTSSPDLILPGHALMVLGELALSPIEAVTTTGICIAGMTALKYAFMNIKSGLNENAIATGSELSSSYMKSTFFRYEKNVDADLEKNFRLAFEADFLRWMLSDGAGAIFLSNKPSDNKPSLKIDWIEIRSFAGSLSTCMYAGGKKEVSGAVKGWRELDSKNITELKYSLAVKQDTKLLEEHIVSTMTETLQAVIKQYNLSTEDITWFLPHYSSDFFKGRFYEGMKEINFEIPYTKWFSNLETKGNTGSASIYIILEELLKSTRLKKGEKLLCFIPESGRFSHCFMLLTVE